MGDNEIYDAVLGALLELEDDRQSLKYSVSELKQLCRDMYDLLATSLVSCHGELGEKILAEYTERMQYLFVLEK